jgi:RNA polymerase sigma-70 factor (ECF subfamily)
MIFHLVARSLARSVSLAAFAALLTPTLAAEDLPKATEGQSSTVQATDSGKSAGMRSFADAGHAVRFEAPEGTWQLATVRIYGSRYGYPKPPQEDFHIWLCDDEMKPLAKFDVPYSKFERGEPTWIDIDVKPTLVPQKYIICVGFDPTQTKGVYVHYDDKPAARSLVGLPGSPPREFKEGNWMIRAILREQ